MSKTNIKFYYESFIAILFRFHDSEMALDSIIEHDEKTKSKGSFFKKESTKICQVFYLVNHIFDQQGTINPLFHDIFHVPF